MSFALLFCLSSACGAFSSDSRHWRRIVNFPDVGGVLVCHIWASRLFLLGLALCISSMRCSRLPSSALGVDGSDSCPRTSACCSAPFVCVPVFRIDHDVVNSSARHCVGPCPFGDVFVFNSPPRIFFVMVSRRLYFSIYHSWVVSDVLISHRCHVMFPEDSM